MRIIITIIFFLVFSLSPLCQNYFGLLGGNCIMPSLGLNANPSLNMNTDFSNSFRHNDKWMESWGLVAQFNIPLFSQKGFDFDLRIGAGTLIIIVDKFKMISGLSWNLSRTSDLNGRFIHSGFKLDLFPGYYRKQWVFAPHFAINFQPWINIRHSDYIKDAFQDLYPDGKGTFMSPKEGWYYQNNIIFQTGLSAVYLLSRWNFNLVAGFQYQPNRLGITALPDIGMMPFYGALNVGFMIDKPD